MKAHFEPETYWIIAWIDRMGVKYGGSVRDTNIGRVLDWGQALAFHRYGFPPSETPDAPDAQDIETAKAWELKLPEHLKPAARKEEK